MARVDPYAPASKVEDDRVARQLAELSKLIREVLDRPQVGAPRPMTASAPATEAVVDKLTPLLAQLGEKLDGLGGRDPELLGAITQLAKRPVGGGGSGRGQIKLLDPAANVINPATEGTLRDVLSALGGPAPAQTKLLDYDVRTDDNPVYVGNADQGTATSAASWTVRRLSYDGSGRAIEIQELRDVAWTSRAVLSWT